MNQGDPPSPWGGGEFSGRRKYVPVGFELDIHVSHAR